MAFVLKQKELKQDGSKEFTYEAMGLKVTFKPFSSPAFQKAYSFIQSKIATDSRQTLTADSVSKQAIGDDSLTYDEALVIAVGEHLIADWDVVDESGEKLPVTGKNLLLVTEQADEPIEFLQWCMESAVDVAKSQAQQATETKKKPSPVTNGKKTTQE